MIEGRVAIVVNGNAKQVTEDLVELLEEIIRSGDLFISRSLEQGKVIARRIVEDGFHTVLTGGGDGTFTQMVTWVTREAERQQKPAPRFGLLRLGTGNAIAWVLGAQNEDSRGVTVDLGRLRDQGGSRELRLVEVEGVMTPFAGFGVDALALKHFQEVKSAFQKVPVLRRFGTGGLAYFTSITGRTMPQVLFQKRGRVKIINEGGEAFRLGPEGRPSGAPIPEGGVVFEGDFRAVLMSTIPYWGFGARVFPFAEEREDRFNIRVVNIGSLDVVWNVRSIWDGSFRDERVQDFLCEKVRFEFARETALEIGGDSAGEHRIARAKLAAPIQVVDYYAPPPLPDDAASEDD